MQEWDDQFLSLFPHRYDYIYAHHPYPGQRPDWQTESRHPLSDRLLNQGAYLFGVRFGQHTRYCMLDIDSGSPYHPKHDPLAISRITAALEPIGLVDFVACTSSASGGLHLYFPFAISQQAWQLATAASVLLDHAGFKVTPGQLEIFPNPKLYVVDGAKNLFNAHRLPMQQGSYLLNHEFEPIFTSQTAFVAHWRFAQGRNDISAANLTQVIREHSRKHYRVSQKAEKFLNDLNAEIEPGWTGPGQTNRLLGRITMRCYIFNHIIHGGVPLEGEALIQEIVKIAKALPGYTTWCQHQHEIEHRATEWANCISNSHYFHYGDQQGKYKAQRSSEQQIPELSWNQQRIIDTQQKIRDTVAQLQAEGKLPTAITARFNILIAAGIGGASLYRYKDLWHPKYQVEELPPTPSLNSSSQLDCAEGASNWPSPTSLLPQNDGNTSNGNASSLSTDKNQGAEASNLPINGPQDIRLLLQQIAQRPREPISPPLKPVPTQENQGHEQHIAMIQGFLASTDPILVAEAIDWLWLNPQVSIKPALFKHLQDCADEDRGLDCLVEIYHHLLRLRWPPEQIQQQLRARYEVSSVAGLTQQQRFDWRSWLATQ